MNNSTTRKYQFSIDPVSLIIPIVLVLGLVVISAIGWSAYTSERDLQAVDEPLLKTESGKFALHNYYACLNSGSLIGKSPTTAACVIEVVAAAKTLRGDQFANDVRDALAIKLISSEK